jgi:hypothetical protein
VKATELEEQTQEAADRLHVMPAVGQLQVLGLLMFWPDAKRLASQAMQMELE